MSRAVWRLLVSGNDALMVLLGSVTRKAGEVAERRTIAVRDARVRLSAAQWTAHASAGRFGGSGKNIDVRAAYSG